MFGGLEIKGESSSSSSEKNKKLDGNNDHDNAASTAPAPAPVTASVPATTVVQSGFSFLSTPFSSSSAKNSNVDSVAGTMTTATDPTFGQHQQEAQQKQEEEDHGTERTKDHSNDFKVNSSDSILLSVLHSPGPIVPSGFSFLSSAAAGGSGAGVGATGSGATATATATIIIKTDTHWDYVMKEMQWLSTDFQSERKRQISLARKQAAGIKQYHATKEKRILKKHAEMEIKRRKIAAKLARDVVKGWWNMKIERVIAYKQKVDADLVRKKVMDRHLVFLVKQTEKYTNLLNRQFSTNGDANSKRNEYEYTFTTSIEEALQQGDASFHARKRQRCIDYQTLAQQISADVEQEREFYGESTEDEAGESDMEDYIPNEEDLDLDDETTFIEAEECDSSVAMKREVELLKQESEMDIEELLKRLEEGGDHVNDGGNGNNHVDGDGDHVSTSSSHLESDRKRVKFSSPLIVHELDKKGGGGGGMMENSRTSSPYHDSEDDLDSIGTNNNESEQDEDGSEEFICHSVDSLDDETTLDAELKLAPEMSAQDEISQLEKEAKMSVEDVMAMYNLVSRNNVEEGEDDDDDDDDDDKSTGVSEEDEEEFQPIHGGETMDDETTIEQEEKLGRDMSYEEEIALLQKENEMPIDELLASYLSNANVDGSDEARGYNVKDEELSKSDVERRQDSNKDDDEDIDEDTGMELDDPKQNDIAIYQAQIIPSTEDDSVSADKHFRSTVTRTHELDQNCANNENRKRRIDFDQSDGSESDDAGNAAMRALEYADTKAKTTAVTRPYLLSSWVKLREYQQVGLNWLVSIQTRRLNGILADEMGLGKTLQTILLLSYLASYKGIWGPHLIIVPTSCIVNWEVELKRFCPAFKVLCYYGSAKRRKELRQGWTKTNWHHIVVTSYQLAVQDSFAFKRKKWYYLVLDEAHNIKNFQSQRWQTLVNFNTQRRLLLTGTPLQNNLMELWSLLHFLMPHVFRSRKEFSYWFSNPMSSIIEGGNTKKDDLIKRLHGIIRPFVLRRLKKDVEKQMPGKYEHIVKCMLSRRQMFLYEEFMARSSTRMALQKGGNYMGMMNVLMQLRKVCNHPDLFEPRSIITPFCTDRISMTTASIIVDALGSKSPLDKVSDRILYPLWSVGCGEPSYDEVLKQNDFVSTERKRLCIEPSLGNKFYDEMSSDHLDGTQLNVGLSHLFKHLTFEIAEDRRSTYLFKTKINRGRCDGDTFLYPSSLQDAIKIDIFSSGVSSADFSYREVTLTPNQLLHLKRTQEKEIEQRASELQKNFLFYVPRAGSKESVLYPLKRSSLDERSLSKLLGSQFEVINRDTRPLFFPDKRLVQFDSGKLQVLSELLRNLKQDKHRVLIFTQMSKMLDILEAFLNINGHTYLRLDGATSVDQRQRYMDRFNNDERMFCFILSTRSGGLGINLTGADTVIFYDSDWNPAMDSQAQDRAHRIGQTRDVHIYRLVTEHSIEENILLKAKQKKHLDILVMDEGKFHSAAPNHISTETQEEEENEKTGDFDISSKAGLRSILGISPGEIGAGAISDGVESKNNFESAMTALEDEDDVLAMQGAQREAKEELEEFDENIKVTKNPEDLVDGEDDIQVDDKTQQDLLGQSNPDETYDQKDALEKEFAAWQSQVGIDDASIDAYLNPVERYALHFKEKIDPFYSMWYISEQQRTEHNLESQLELDIEYIESLKAEEEKIAIENGDLLTTMPDPQELLRQRYLYSREKSRLRANIKRRRLTGENWSAQTDGRTKLPFWYNSDTGEALWQKPQILLELEEHERASKMLWNAAPHKILVKVMDYLLPFPERMLCAQTCKQWKTAANDISYVRHVYPVEMGALTMDRQKMPPNHYRTITEALEQSLPGDTIELGDGHYWVNEPELVVTIPIRIIGDEKDPSHVVIEISGTIIWKGSAGFIEGITFRRPRIGESGGEMDIFSIERGSKVSIVRSVFAGRVKPSINDYDKNHSFCCGLNVKGSLTMDNCDVCTEDPSRQLISITIHEGEPPIFS
mmetsp:Transcript_2774/g.5185  ORF Transcript_2774/g.5185 Transcript_2774/m.5185 type:complete len:2007 (-) Transcript_2774:2717-8737(-)